MNNKNLLIFGAGQYGIIAKETAEAVKCFDKIAFLDDKSENSVGKFDEYENFVTEYNYAFVAVGNSELRLKWIQKLEEACYRVAILVHSRAYVSPSAQLQKGCIVEPNAVIQANSALSIGVIISAGAIVNHDCFVGDVCHIDVGAIVQSNSVVKAHTHVKAGTVFSGTNIADSKENI
jgi:UDP-N-acetylbacillosamine N-acetyltransferase